MNLRKIFYGTLFLCCLNILGMNAQVTIGSESDPHPAAVLDLSQATDLGLILPRVGLRNVEYFQLDGDSTTAIGTLVYNTALDTKGGSGIIGEYIWTGTKWRTISVDGGMMTILPTKYLGSPDNKFTATNPQISSDTIVNTDCDMGGSYIFTLIAGQTYANVYPSSSITPDFNVAFENNPTGVERNAVVLVTDPCGKTSTFVFSQEKAACISDMQPTITPYFGTVICDDGAVYAHVSAIALLSGTASTAVEDHTYYWLLNNSIVKEGAGVSLGVAGTYTVYVNQVGCGTPGKIIVTKDVSSPAPKSKQIIVNNEGIICGASGTVKLSALNALPTDEIYWFKDGVRYRDTPSSSIVLTGEGKDGDWYAVVVDGDLASTPSNIVTVTYNDGMASIAIPQATVNDLNIDGTDGDLTFCANGSLKLEITNLSDPTYINPVFTWYANDIVLGQSDGHAIYVVPASFTSMILSVEATVVGICPASATSNEIEITFGTIPAATILNGGAEDAYICGTHDAVLIAAVQDGVTYEWFKTGNPEPISGAAGFEYNASEPGLYSVRYSNASGCWSQLSPSIRVTQSNAVNLSWGVKPEAEEINTSSKTYSVVAAPEASKYTWKTNDAIYGTTAEITPLGNGSSALVTYKGVGVINPNFKIMVTAENGCGESTLTSADINVKNGCEPISAMNVVATKSTIFGGESVTYTVTVNTGSPAFTYKWYLDNVQQPSTDASYTFTPTNAQAGIHTVYAKVTNECSTDIQSPTVTIKVESNPDTARPVPPAGVFTNFLNQKTCLDVHKTGDIGTNSWNKDRLPLNTRPNDFATLSAGTYNFAYTFFGEGGGYTVGTVKYVYKDPSNVVEEVTGNGTNTGLLKFKPSIITAAQGRLNNNPVSVTLYAIYTISGVDYKDSVIVNIQDGACGCPVKITNSTWKMFQCHSLGANTNVDPFTFSANTYGGYWKFGRKAQAGTQTGTSGGIDQTYGNNNDWNMATENPCPRGWKVPAESDFGFAASGVNTWTRKGSHTVGSMNAGTLIGSYLPLPMAGYRATLLNSNVGARVELGTAIHMWTTRSITNAGARNILLYGYNNTVNRTGLVDKGYGEIIRCVSEGPAYSN